MTSTYCIYCNSSSFGRGCSYSPTDTHVHMDDPGKCIYCGSPSIGPNCEYNPYGKTHVRGPEFLNRSAIRTEKAAVLSYFLNVAQSLVVEGMKYTSPLDRFYKRMAGIIASASEPLIEAFLLQETPSLSDLSRSQFTQAIDYKIEIKKQLNKLNKTIFEASLSLPEEIVEKTLIDAIMEVDVQAKD